MKQVDLNDLPQWSRWPSHLLGLTPWTISSRTIEKIEEEYEHDKYLRCLQYWANAGENNTTEDIRQFEFGLESDDKVCLSVGDKLYETTLEEARSHWDKLFLDTVRGELEKCNSVIELGAGYGYNLWRLRRKWPNLLFLGGEYSKKAIELASRLYDNDPGIKVQHFNFYEASSYDLIDLADPPILVLTVHAIEQLPCSSMVFDCLVNFREKITGVVHFEPVHELYGNSLLGLMRSRYTEVNDYNRDLYSELQKRPDIRIIDIQSNVLGLNPMNPTSVICWEFVQCGV